MDRINFLAKDDFPFSADTANMMQSQTLLAAKMALLGGGNYILSGCVDNGKSVTDGFIVIGGELLPFQGGAKKERVSITETYKTLSAFGNEYPEAYVYRYAKLSDAGTHDWDDFTQVLTNKDIENRLNSLKGEETGFVKMWSGRVDRIPEDYRLCNGDIVSTKDYPELAYSFGKETETRFALPDLRRRFVVGYDNAVDSGYNEMWSKGGQETVTLTEKQMPKHTHKIKFVDEKWGDNANSRPFPNPAGTAGYSAETTETGGGEAHENRPPFNVLAYVVKVK
ncbi:MAG: hypothetical protein GX963_03045 [Bacteroidales bacterium]|nr:hypothetical protein [Bacteroidales bacterium]